MTEKRLKDEMRELAKSKSDALNLISGILGINIGGQPTVEISSREGFVWVRLRGNTSELIQAYNGSVSPIFGLPVLVTRSGNKYSIVGRDVEKYDNWGESSYLPKHGTQHSFAPELGFGGDVTWIYSRQFVPLSAVPSGSAGAGSVIINSYVYRSPGDGAWKFLGDVGSPIATGLNPTGTSARMLLLCVNADTNTPLFITGTTFFSSSLTGTASIAPYIPPMNNNHFLPISAIRLVSGTDVIGWDNIYDMRQFSVTTPVPFVGGLMVRDEGADVGTGSIINFVGAGVNAVVSGDTITVSVTGSTVEIQDEGVSQGSVSALNFVGNNVDAMVIGSTARIFITGSTGAGTTAIQDEGAPKGDVLTFNFVGGNVDASVSGTVVRVFVTGSSGGSVSTGAIQAIGDARWLKLDTSNDPLTGDLQVTGSITLQGDLSVEETSFFAGTVDILNPATYGLQAEIHNTNIVGNFIQLPDGNSPIQNPVLYLYREPLAANWNPEFQEHVLVLETADGSGTTTGGLLKYWLNSVIRTDINPSQVGTGTAVLFDTENLINVNGKLLLLANQGANKFYVNGSGTAYSNDVALIKEAPADGNQWSRKNSGWEITAGPAGPAGPAGAFGVMGWDEGVPIGTGTILNFIGTNVDVSLSGTVLRVFVTGSSAGTVFSGVDQIGIYALDEGVPLGTGTTLNFTGAGVTATISGTVVNIDIPGGGGGMGFVGKHLGAYVATGTVLDVRGGLTASGTVLNLNVQKYIPLLITSAPGTPQAFTNQPAADSGLVAFLLTDLKGYSQARLSGRFGSVAPASASGTYLHLKYSIDGTGFVDIAKNPDINGQLIWQTNANNNTGWFDIQNNAAVDDVWMELFSTGGNGAADPTYLYIGSEFR